jgi:hypothetical protein
MAWGFLLAYNFLGSMFCFHSLQENGLPQERGMDPFQNWGEFIFVKCIDKYKGQLSPFSAAWERRSFCSSFRCWSLDFKWVAGYVSKSMNLCTAQTHNHMKHNFGVFSRVLLNFIFFKIFFFIISDHLI